MSKLNAILQLIKAKDWCVLTHEHHRYRRIFQRYYRTLYSMKNPTLKEQTSYLIEWLEHELKILKQWQDEN